MLCLVFFGCYMFRKRNFKWIVRFICLFVCFVAKNFVVDTKKGAKKKNNYGKKSLNFERFGETEKRQK